MAFEQIRGAAHHLDGRTDIWALGVILSEILCGRRPFSGSRDRVFDEVLNRDPKPPRQVDNTVPQELETICLKCLEKSTSARYGNGGDVAKAIREWLATGSADVAFDATPRSNSSVTRRFNVLLAAGNSSSSRRVLPLVETPRRGRPIWPWLALVALLALTLVLWTPVWGLLSVSAPGPRDWKPGRLYEVLDRRPDELL
jgi:serine/threonine protein kinase